MRLVKYLKEKVSNYYFQKGVRKAALQLKQKLDENDNHIMAAISHINKSIELIEEEVKLYSDAIIWVEGKYGKNDVAEKLSTIFPFINLSMLDILILSRQFLLCKDPVEQNLICRTAAQHMYEFLEDGSKVLGKEIGHVVVALKNPEIDTALKSLRKSFNDLKDELHPTLKVLRHNVAGHKDRDIQNQLMIKQSVKAAEFEQTFFKFLHFFALITVFKNSVNQTILAKRLIETSSEFDVRDIGSQQQD